MKNENHPIITLHNLLDYDVHKFSNAEVQLKHELTHWKVQASSVKLKTIIDQYIDFTEDHIRHIEKYVVQEKIAVLSVNNRIMKAFIEEANEKMSLCKDHEVRDACLIEAIQEINLFKLSMYGTAASFAKELDMTKMAALFHAAEMDEIQIDNELTDIAEKEINEKARKAILLKL